MDPNAVPRFILLLLLLAPLAQAQPASDDPNDPAVLWSEATLYRDEWGMPHVYAENLRSMAFAFGYAQAEDHIEPMLMAYRAVNGRSAEVLGEARLPQDTYALQMRFSELAKAAFETVDPDVRDLCEGFALGVNTWLLEYPEKAPRWAEGVEPHEILALLHAFLLAHAPFDFPEGDVRDPGMLSAHAWAVAPEHSDANQAMLVINPHAEFEGIYRWYEAHLAAEDYEVAGATIYGLPLLLVGHGPRHGWAIAPNKADVADLYDEETFRHFERTKQYRDVYVRVGEGLEKRTISTWFSENGPIVATNLGRPLAWKVGGYGEFDTLGQLIDMGRAESLDQFIAALDLDGLPCFNVVYADAEGTIFYVYNAVTGTRPAQAIRASENAQRTVWERPVPGYGVSFQWGDPFPPSELPTLSNPESGYIIASGTPPWTAASQTDLVRDEFPHWLVRDSDSAHAARLRQLFDRGPRSYRDVQSMLFDAVAQGAEQPVRFLLDAAEAFPDIVDSGHPDLPAALDMMREWDFLASEDDPAITYFHVWNSIYTKAMTKLEITPDLPTRQQTALRAASDAARLLVNTYQSLFVPWGEVHVLLRGDEEIPLAGGASGDPVFRSDDTRFVDGKWTATSGYAYAMIVQFTDPPSSISLVPFGASNDPESPHFADQMPLLRERRMKVVRTRYEDVLRGAVSARGAALEFIDRSNRVRVEISSDAALQARLIASNRFERKPEEGLVAFSPYVEPLVAPTDVDIVIDFTFSIPDHLCASDDLEALSIYSYHPDSGWQVVEEQSTDRAARTLTARDYYDQIYVVLGPEQFLRRDPVERLDDTTIARLEDVPVQLLPDEARSDRQVRSRGAGSGDELAEALGQRIERDPPQPIAENDPAKNPFGATPGVLAEAPEAAPAPAAPMPESVPPAVPESAPETVLDGVDPQPDNLVFSPGDDPSSEHVSEFTPIEPESAPQAADDDAGYERGTRDGDTVVIRGRGDAGSAPPGDLMGSNPRLSVSYESPAEWRGDRGREAFRLYLAPDASQASELKIGSDLELNPPVDNILIRMFANASVRAQSFIVDTPPAAYPAGLVPFTSLVAVRRDSDTVPCTVAVTMRVAPGDCDPQHAERLALYLYDAETGWLPMPGAKRPAPLSYQGIDTDARTYAVLGPAELRRN